MWHKVPILYPFIPSHNSKCRLHYVFLKSRDTALMVRQWTYGIEAIWWLIFASVPEYTVLQFVYEEKNWHKKDPPGGLLLTGRSQTTKNIAQFDRKFCRYAFKNNLFLSRSCRPESYIAPITYPTEKVSFFIHPFLSPFSMIAHAWLLFFFIFFLPKEAEEKPWKLK